MCIRDRFKIIPILMGVIISYVVAFIMNAAGITNPDGSATVSYTHLDVYKRQADG